MTAGMPYLRQQVDVLAPSPDSCLSAELYVRNGFHTYIVSFTEQSIKPCASASQSLPLDVTVAMDTLL